MAIINLSAGQKLARSTAIATSLGAGATLSIYSGAQPVGPDVAAGTPLAVLPMATPSVGTASICVGGATVASGGSGGTNGAVTLTGGSSATTKFQATGTISGGVLSGPLVVTVAGLYPSLPSNLAAEPVTGGGLTGATVSLEMASQLVFGTIPQQNASGTNTATWGRLATSAGVGMVDVDVGTAGTSIVINTTAIVAGGPVVISSAVILEA